MSNTKRSSFKGSIGFVLAAASSAVGLGNIWRFPYLAARDGGGLFVVVYIVLALSFGFTLLTAELGIGRKTRQGPLTAYSSLKKGWKSLGIISCLVPVIILPYYCAIGGWVLKYLITFATGHGVEAAADNYFTEFITGQWEPIALFLIFFIAVVFIIIMGVNKGIELSSKIIMPALLILVIFISIFTLTIKHEVPEFGEVRTGIQGLGVYLIPDFKNMTFGGFLKTVMDAMGQLFFSLSIAMGIMVAYGSYVDDKANMSKSVNQIEIFDTVVAILAGVMIIPAVYIFMGKEGLSASGPSLMFVTLPKVFEKMGTMGNVIAVLFFAMVLFAALSSAVSVMEAIVSSFMDEFHIKRREAAVLEGVIALIGGIFVCLGYNKMYFELKLPTGSTGQILDVMDYVSNSILMPLVAIATCVLVGWVLKPKTIIEEFTKNGEKFGRQKIFEVMIKFIAPVLLFILFLQSSGLVKFPEKKTVETQTVESTETVAQTSDENADSEKIPNTGLVLADPVQTGSEEQKTAEDTVSVVK